MIGTRILKIDLELSEIIEVKVGNHHLEIDILLLHRGRKINLYVKLETLTSIQLSRFDLDFQNSCAYHVANFLNFSKLPQLLQLG